MSSEVSRPSAQWHPRKELQGLLQFLQELSVRHSTPVPSTPAGSSLAPAPCTPIKFAWNPNASEFVPNKRLKLQPVTINPEPEIITFQEDDVIAIPCKRQKVDDSVLPLQLDSLVSMLPTDLCSIDDDQLTEPLDMFDDIMDSCAAAALPDLAQLTTYMRQTSQIVDSCTAAALPDLTPLTTCMRQTSQIVHDVNMKQQQQLEEIHNITVRLDALESGQTNSTATFTEPSAITVPMIYDMFDYILTDIQFSEDADRERIYAGDTDRFWPALANLVGCKSHEVLLLKHALEDLIYKLCKHYLSDSADDAVGDTPLRELFNAVQTLGYCNGPEDLQCIEDCFNE